MNKKIIQLSLKTFLFLGITSSISFSQVGSVGTLAGSTQGNSDGIGISAKLNNPAGICISNDGSTLYFTDSQNHLVKKIDIATALVSTIAGTGFSGSIDGIGTAASFNFPNGICASNDGKYLFVADKENHKIRKINLLTSSVTTFAGTGFSGDTDFIGKFAEFKRPGGICVNSSGTYLYVADSDNNAIRRIDLITDSMVSTVAGVTGNSGNGFVNGVGTAAKFFNPRGICISPDGLYIYVGDDSNHSVRKIEINSSTVTTLAGDGNAGSTNGIGTGAKFANPSGLSISSDGLTLYVADFSNFRIRKINTSSANVTTLAGSSSGYVDNTDGTLAKFAGPVDIIRAKDDIYLYVIDRQNNRVRTVKAIQSASLNELDFNNKIYPNPVDNVLVLDESNINDISSLEIISLDGKSIKIVNLQGNQIEVNDLKSGIYLLKMTYKNGRFENTKFLKK